MCLADSLQTYLLATYCCSHRCSPRIGRRGEFIIPRGLGPQLLGSVAPESPVGLSNAALSMHFAQILDPGCVGWQTCRHVVTVLEPRKRRRIVRLSFSRKEENRCRRQHWRFCSAFPKRLVCWPRGSRNGPGLLLRTGYDLLHFRASLSILTAFFLTCHTGPARSTNNGKRMYVKDFMPCKVLQNGTTLRFGYF